MEELAKKFKKTGELHHAYLLEGEADGVRAELFKFLEKELEHPTRGNPDFWHEAGDTLSIERARAIIEMQSVRPIAYQRKVFVIEVRGMNVEAQNALLKMFEEPAVGVHFFIIVPSANIFLPTLRSRMFVLRPPHLAKPSHPSLSRRQAGLEKEGMKSGDFLSLSPAKCLEFIAPIIEEKNRAAAIGLVEEIIRKLAEKKEKRDKAKIEELLTLRSYLNDKSASLKLILEHCAICLIH